MECAFIANSLLWLVVVLDGWAAGAYLTIIACVRIAADIVRAFRPNSEVIR
jgi:hypothetical protein